MTVRSLEDWKKGEPWSPDQRAALYVAGDLAKIYNFQKRRWQRTKSPLEFMSTAWVVVDSVRRADDNAQRENGSLDTEDT